MLQFEDYGITYVRVSSDTGKMILDKKTGRAYSEIIAERDGFDENGYREEDEDE